MAECANDYIAGGLDRGADGTRRVKMIREISITFVGATEIDNAVAAAATSQYAFDTFMASLGNPRAACWANAFDAGERAEFRKSMNRDAT